METIFEYNMIIIPAMVGIFSQFLKFLIFTMKHGWQPRYAITHGHMPSAHSAFIVSLLTAVGYYSGINSGSFAVAAALAIIVIDDAARLRVYMGDQGRYLNNLIRELKISREDFPRLKERIGHRISEVIIGSLIGFLLTLALIQLLQ